MKLIIDISKDRYDEIMAMDWRNCRRFFDEEIRAIHDGMPQRTGHWIIISPTDMYCSECNEIEHLDTSRRFCAYCGTRMVESQAEKE
jgi:NADH pyrophosphatase NudC (nudix superfamily)